MDWDAEALEYLTQYVDLFESVVSKEATNHAISRNSNVVTRQYVDAVIRKYEDLDKVAYHKLINLLNKEK